MSTSKTGKHGHAKCHFVALDIFTQKKMEELVPSSHNLDVRARSTLPGCLVQHESAEGGAGCSWTGGPLGAAGGCCTQPHLGRQRAPHPRPLHSSGGVALALPGTSF